MSSKWGQMGICLLLLGLLVGCWDSRNVEQIYHAHTIGVDFQDEEFLIYVQVLNFQAMAGSGEGGGNFDLPQAYVAIGKGKTFVEAIHYIYTHSERQISWGHLAAIVFSEEALKHQKAIIGTFESLGRFYETRNTTWIFASNSPLVELLTTFPKVEFSVLFSSLGEPTQTYEQSSFVAPIRLHHFLAIMNEPGRTNIFPILEVEKRKWFLNNSQPRPSIFMAGAALLEDLRFRGFLLGKDMLGIRWIQPTTMRTPIRFEHGGTATLKKPKVKIEPQLEDEQISFTIRLKTSGFISELHEDRTITEVEQEIASMIKQEIRHTFEKGLETDADVLQLSASLYKHNPKLWHKRVPEGKLLLTKESLKEIHVEVEITHAGRDKFRSLREHDVPMNYWKENNKSE